MTAGCVRCGDCCDPVEFNVPAFDARMMERIDVRWLDREDNNEAWVNYYADIRWIYGHWHDNGDGTATCDAFDPATRTCTAHDARPPICRNFPWYGERPDRTRRHMSENCSYQADLPVGERDPDWQPVKLVAGQDMRPVESGG